MGNTNSAPAATLGGSAFSGNTSQSTGVNNLASDLKPAGSEAATKVKPCCVCKDEKSVRDECMLFSRSDDPAQNDCKSLVEQYRACMKGYGFELQ